MRGAGGTSGGIGRFFVGLVMLVTGGYLFLSSVVVHGWHWGHGLWGVGGYSVTTGMLILPLMAGFAFLFYDAKNPIGWILTAGSLLLIVVGIVTSLRLHLRTMSLFELLMILLLAFGGLGLLLSALRPR